MEIARCFGTGINVEEARDKVTVILRQPTPVQNMVDQKQSQNMERINYFVRMITNEARYTRIIKSAQAKSSIQHEELSFHQQVELKLNGETNQVLHLEHRFLW